jgi:hypothetical protein
MALSAYEEFAKEPLVFPYRGKEYVLPPVNIPNGRLLGKILEGKDKKLNQIRGEELWKIVLGGLWEKFLEDDVPLDFAVRCGLTALADIQYGREYAEVTWKVGADPKALQKYMAEEKATQAAPTPNRAQRRSTGTASVKKTQ